MTAPAEQLRAAAAKIRETAAKATPGPWVDMSTEEDSIYPRWIMGPPTVPDDPWSFTEPIKVTGDLVDHEIVSREDTAWIALMSPALAEPLAAWLEKTAETVRHHEPDTQYDGLPNWQWCTGCDTEECEGLQNITAALTVARAVLGEPITTPVPSTIPARDVRPGYVVRHHSMANDGSLWDVRITASTPSRSPLSPGYQRLEWVLVDDESVSSSVWLHGDDGVVLVHRGEAP